MLGNEAVARGAYEAGCRVATAYPGTPSTEITEFISRYDEVYSEWSPNEKVALEVAIGAAIAGARSICSMKHVGLNVAADPLFTSSYTGVNAGLVIVVADDPGMHSSQNEQDSRHYARSSKVPMLEPSDSRECREFVMEAFRISETFDTPVIIRLTTRVSHSRSIVETGERQEVPLRDYKKDVGKYVMMPAMARKRHIFVEERMKKLKEYSENSALNRIEWGRRDIGIITSGISYQYAKEAFGDVSYLKLGMVYPLPEATIREFAESVDKVIVIEELDPFLEEQINAIGINVTGKDMLPLTGEYSQSLLARIFFNKDSGAGQPNNPDIPARPPVLCPGCPHRGVFYVLKKLKYNVMGDIGCYTLGALPPLEAMDTCLCMGASVGMAYGMEKARGKEFAGKTVAVIGDSTFIHSGITGLIDIAYNGGSSTIIVLDNSITGMTGHQHNPMSGYNIKGEPANSVDIELLASSIGIKRVRVVDPFDLVALEKAVKEETSAGEPSLVIARRPCALLKNVPVNKPLRIDRDKCKYCRMCLRIGCPAIADRGTYVEINDALCNGCTFCTGICRFDAINN
jgi:indolepyruvate ferredoxin oxidoreductase alpha subunit